MSKVHFSLHTALTAWQWSPFSVCVPVALVIIGYFYLRADWRLASRGRRWPARRTVAFLAGLVAVDLALQSPVATFTASYFQAHVAQHLLLMVVAPPLLALGAPSTLLLQTAGRATKKKWLAVLRSRPFAIATHPVLVWFFYFGAMFAFFLSPMLNFAMEHMAIMDAVNLAFLLGGTFYWWPMVGLDPIVHWRMGYGARLANLALGVPFESFLGIAIMSRGHPSPRCTPCPAPGPAERCCGQPRNWPHSSAWRQSSCSGAGRRPGWAQSRRQGSTGADGAGPRTTTGGPGAC